MNEISLDREGAEHQLKKIEDAATGIDDVLKNLPEAPDGGLASAIMSLITQTGVEASGIVAATYHSFHAVTTEVLDDMTLNEQGIAQEIREFEAGF